MGEWNRGECSIPWRVRVRLGSAHLDCIVRQWCGMAHDCALSQESEQGSAHLDCIVRRPHALRRDELWRHVDGGADLQAGR